MLKRLTCLAFGLALLTAPAMAEELTVEQIIANHIEAIGGRDTLDSINTLRLSGKMSMPGGMEAPISIVQKRPNKMRVDVEFQGMGIVQAFDGTTAWMIMPFQGNPNPEPMSAEQTDDMKQQADIDGPFVDYKDKGHTIELVGKEDMEGSEVYKLKVTLKGGDVQHYFFDAEYFLPLKMESKTEFQGTEVEVENIFGDYKEVGGLMVAHSFEQRPKGAPAGQAFSIETVDINPDVADEDFTMPEVEAADEVEAGE
jgi:outer membrane lipoprotein-sorting protein